MSNHDFVGWYAEARRGGVGANGNHYPVKIVGGPVELDYKAYGGAAGPVLWTVATEGGETFVAVESNMRHFSRRSHNRWQGDPLYAECPECGDEEFFLEGDYVCGYCRTNRLDP